MDLRFVNLKLAIGRSLFESLEEPIDFNTIADLQIAIDDTHSAAPPTKPRPFRLSKTSPRQNRFT
jgi:hypothetical protein